MQNSEKYVKLQSSQNHRLIPLLHFIPVLNELQQYESLSGFFCNYYSSCFNSSTKAENIFSLAVDFICGFCRSKI